MSKIQPLSDAVINQIAAGEVVERPVSVVKELVENALDANATQIQVHIEKGGKKLIRVVDNGVGISKEDLANATKRHWTSKLNSIDDLRSLVSLGFRGEALASIAAVSKVVMRSRPQDSEHGWEAIVDYGQALEVKPTGIAPGTEVKVMDLFANIPARAKFLKSDATELAHISEYVKQVALIHPNCGFTLLSNDKEAFRTAGDGNVDQLISTILPSSLVGKMIPVNSDHPQVKVSGWVGQPGTGVTQRPKQYLFVNQRPVEVGVIKAALYKGFERHLGRQEKPQYIIIIEIAPHLVDFNIHPQKKEVKFINNDLVFKLVQQAVMQALGGYDFRTESPKHQAVTSEAQIPSSVSLQDTGRITPQSAFDQKSPPVRSTTDYLPAADVMTSLIGEKKAIAADWSDTKPSKCFQLLNLFIIEEIEDGMMVYDQHAVHERVLYERLVHRYLDQEGAQATQALLVPVEIELSETEQALLQENQETLEQLGFAFQLEGPILQIKRVPAELADLNLNELLHEYLADLSLTDAVASPIKSINDQTHRQLAYLACRSAIKAGDKLSEVEIRKLMEDYAQTEINSTCPHGRPVQVKITREEMEKWFRR